MKNIIICGPSAAGKDTVARFLLPILNKENKNFHLVISNTTRPMRKNEQQNIDYHFCSTVKEFDNFNYLEQTSFRGWKYGVPIENVKNNTYNILVLNPNGVVSAINKLDNYIIIYLYENFFIRFLRSIKREKKFHFEILRRGITDTFDFWKFEQFCKKNNIRYFKIKNNDIAQTIKDISFILFFEEKKFDKNR